MAEMTIQQAIEVALQYHNAGHLRQAEELYKQILKFDPGKVDAMHLLGVLAHQGTRSDLAVQMISRAISAKPDMPAPPIPTKWMW